MIVVRLDIEEILQKNQAESTPEETNESQVSDQVGIGKTICIFLVCAVVPTILTLLGPEPLLWPLTLFLGLATGTFFWSLAGM